MEKLRHRKISCTFSDMHRCREVLGYFDLLQLLGCVFSFEAGFVLKEEQNFLYLIRTCDYYFPTICNNDVIPPARERGYSYVGIDMIFLLTT